MSTDRLLQQLFAPVCLGMMFLSLCQHRAFSQSFTQVTTGDIVTDPTYSWGCAFGDFNNDGKLDLFVGNNGINALYRGNGDSTFVRISTGPFGTDNGNCRGGGWGDYNNDGYLDLFVPNNGSFCFLYKNNGPDSGYSFTKITGDPMVSLATDHRGSSWGDFDNDGFIDMIIARNGDEFLFRNNGNGTFSRIDTGAVVTSGGLSIGPTWCDYDNDGDVDLFIANMQSFGNFLFTNRGNGWFARVTSGPVATDAGAGAGGSWGDFDNDGDFDLFVANAPGTNFFYINNGPDSGYTFTKVTSGPIATDAGVSYGSTWADFDNDGDLDLFVSNNDDPNFYYLNNGPPNYSFTKITAINLATDPGTSWGSCVGDIDRDGDLDVFIANSAQNSLYLNDGNSNHWLSIKCKGTISNRAALGARVSVKASIGGISRWQVRDVGGQTSYYSQGSLNTSFGLGNATTVDSIVIRWPSGMVDRYSNVAANRILTASEGGGLTGIEESSTERPARFTLRQNYPNPFNPMTTISYEIGSKALVSLRVFDVLGREVANLVNRELAAGAHKVEWDASAVSSGVYFYRLAAGDFTQMKRMVLLK